MLLLTMTFYHGSDNEITGLCLQLHALLFVDRICVINLQIRANAIRFRVGQLNQGINLALFIANRMRLPQ